MEEQIERMLCLLEVVDEATSRRYLSLIARTFIAAQLREFAGGLEVAFDEPGCWRVQSDES
jgi:hypothetical protein